MKYINKLSLFVLKYYCFLTEQIQLKLPGNYYVGEVSKKHIDLKNLIFNIVANDKIIVNINKHHRIFYINDETDCETSVIFLLNIVIDLMNLYNYSKN